MGRVLAIDYGKKRTGLAATDPLKIIASPLATVETPRLIDYLREYFQKEEVETIVLGYPLKLDLSATHTTQDVLQLEAKLKTTFPTKNVVLQDERLTSRIAQDAMIRGGMKKKDRRNKANVDRISATLILQEFLEKNF